MSHQHISQNADLADATQRRLAKEQAEDARRRKLHAAGYSDAQAARILGVSDSTVRNWRKATGLQSNGRGIDL